MFSMFSKLFGRSVRTIKVERHYPEPVSVGFTWDGKMGNWVVYGEASGMVYHKCFTKQEAKVLIEG